MKTLIWKVYGIEGHRQRESFHQSIYNDFSKGDKTRIVEVLNADKTGTHDYSIIRITRNTEKECEEELLGQLGDGVFENSRTGNVVEISEDELEKLITKAKTRTFIFLKNVKWSEDSQRKTQIICGMVQSEYYPSGLINDPSSNFHGCDCVEVTANCYIKIGYAD